MERLTRPEAMKRKGDDGFEARSPNNSFPSRHMFRSPKCIISRLEISLLVLADSDAGVILRMHSGN